MQQHLDRQLQRRVPKRTLQIYDNTVKLELSCRDQMLSRFHMRSINTHTYNSRRRGGWREHQLSLFALLPLLKTVRYEHCQFDSWMT